MGRAFYATADTDSSKVHSTCRLIITIIAIDSIAECIVSMLDFSCQRNAVLLVELTHVNHKVSIII